MKLKNHRVIFHLLLCFLSMVFVNQELSAKQLDFDGIKKQLDEGNSLVYFPNTDTTYKWRRVDGKNKRGFEVGVVTYYERINRMSNNLNMVNASIFARALAMADKAVIPLPTSAVSVKNPFRHEATGSEFTVAAFPVGESFFISSVGPYRIENNSLGNNKTKRTSQSGRVVFFESQSGRELIYGTTSIWRDDKFRTQWETIGQSCIVSGMGTGTCSDIGSMVTRKTREAGMYPVTTVTTGVAAPSALVYLNQENTSIRFSVPQAGKIYVTDALLFPRDDSFSWQNKNCITKNEITDDIGGKHTECPLFDVSFIRMKGDGEILKKLKDRLQAGGWSQEWLDRIEYLPLSGIQ